MSRMETSPHPSPAAAGDGQGDDSDGTGRHADGGALRVVVVDDSAVIRNILTRVLESDPGVSVVETAHNGARAVRRVPRLNPDVVVLDIDMPVMDGLEALPHLIRDVPGLPVIVASTLTTRNADITLRALAAGAADYIAKPGNSTGVGDAGSFRADLLAKVRALGETRRRRDGQALPVCPGSLPSTAIGLAPDMPARQPQPAPPRAVAVSIPEAVVIASSTGGPQALFTLLAGLPSKFHLPVLIAQHMPPTFTEMLASQIARVSGRPCRQAVDGEEILDGHIYVAPGDYHMTVFADVTARANGRKVRRLRLDQGPKENYCRPSADPLLRSAAAAWGDGALAVVLTGMGTDGLTGCRAVAKAGGGVIAQDEASSVVWGMPGAVVRNGLANAIQPIGEIARTLGAIGDGTWSRWDHLPRPDGP